MKTDRKPLRCAKCDSPLHEDYLKGGSQICYHCRRPVDVTVFPAFYMDRETGGSGESRTSEEEAACFYHQQKRAERICASCGRFICDLCSVKLDESDICARCLEISVENKEYAMFENRRVLYDGIALQLSVFPMIFVIPTILTAPAAMYMCVRYWKTPLSVTSRTRIRFVLAFLLSGAQMYGWFYILYNAFMV